MTGQRYLPLGAIADHDNPVDVGENDEEELEDIMENFTARATIDTVGLIFRKA